MPANSSPNVVALTDVVDIHRRLVELGATDAEIAIGVGYRDQCNIAFSAGTLRVFGELGLDVSLSCWEETS